MRLRAFVSAVMLCLAFLPFAAEGQEVKFRRTSESPAPFGRYRVTVAVVPGDDLDIIVRQLVGTYRGRLEPYAEEGFTGFVVVTSEESARLLSRDRRVVLVEQLAPSGGEAAVEAPTVPVIDEPEAAVALHPTLPTARPEHAPPPPGRVRTNETNSTWSIGPYAYDGSGNIKSIGRSDGTKDTFVYDAFGRLTSGTAGAGKQQEYTYDEFGNLLTITTDGDTARQTKLGVDPATNQISRSSHPTTGAPYNAYGTFDDSGNMEDNVAGTSSRTMAPGC